jgi:hypothetical protein
MSHQEISETFLRMGAITRRFLAAVNYRGNPALPLFPWYPSRPPALPRLVVPTRTVVLVTATLPASFVPGAPSSPSSL